MAPATHQLPIRSLRAQHAAAMRHVDHNAGINGAWPVMLREGGA
jgi:hypothetical protein